MAKNTKKARGADAAHGETPEGHAFTHTDAAITNLSIDGNEYEVNEDGDILIPLEHVVAASAHGFTVV